MRYELVPPQHVRKAMALNWRVPLLLAVLVILCVIGALPSGASASGKDVEALPTTRPVWAAASGKDDAGAWADLKVGDLTQRFRLIPAGAFQMGSPADEADRGDDETQHEVTLSQAFWLADSECTQGLWQAVMGGNPSMFKGDARRPVERVSWDDCQSFMRKLATLAGGGTFSLPTEAQWEYACRAGTKGAFAGDLDAMAWYDNKEGNETHPVKTKRPNGWGLYDMHGNVSEWVADWYVEYTGAQRDPNAVEAAGPYGQARSFRGGCYYLPARNCRSAIRDWNEPGSVRSFRGFRLSAPAQADTGGADH